MRQNRIFVAITGTLSAPRKAVAERIDATANGHFVESVTLETHYLVAAIVQSKKTKKAARYGTHVISERELEAYLAAGTFPPTALPTYKIFHPNNFPDFVWDRQLAEHQAYVLTYRDAAGDLSMRPVIAFSWGYDRKRPDAKYLCALDSEGIKTYRTDRIVEMEEIPMSDVLVSDAQP